MINNGVSSDNVGVYAIVSPSGKHYIGMTCNSFNSRWSQHHRALQALRHHAIGLQRSYDKYGWEAHEKLILQEWPKPDSVEELLLLEKNILLAERKWWEDLNSTGIVMLHGCPSGTGSVIHSDETKLVISEKNKQARKKALDITEEEREVILSQLINASSWSDAKIRFGISKQRMKIQGFNMDEANRLIRKKPKTLNPQDTDPDYDTMYDLYVTQQLTIREVGKHIGKTHPTVLRILKKRGIPVRTPQESRDISYAPIKEAKSSEMRKCAVCTEDYPVAERPRGNTCGKSCQGKYRKPKEGTPEAT